MIELALGRELGVEHACAGQPFAALLKWPDEGVQWPAAGTEESGPWSFDAPVQTPGGKDVWGALAKNDREYGAFREVAEKQRTTLDRDARRDLVADLQRRMASNLWTFTWPAADTPIVSHRSVHNFRPRPGWNGGGLRSVWKDA